MEEFYNNRWKYDLALCTPFIYMDTWVQLWNQPYNCSQRGFSHYYWWKPLTVWITTNCGKFLKRWEYQITWLASWEIWMHFKKQQLELDMEWQTASKSGKAVCCHPAYLTDMQSTSWEMLGWIKCKLESRLLGEISRSSDMQMTPPLWKKVKRN